MADILKAFQNGTRLHILRCLHGQPRNVSYLVNKCDMSQSAVSQHLGVLAKADVLEREKSGHQVYYSLADEEFGVLAKRLLDLQDNY